MHVPHTPFAFSDAPVPLYPYTPKMWSCVTFGGASSLPPYPFTLSGWSPVTFGENERGELIYLLRCESLIHTSDGNPMDCLRQKKTRIAHLFAFGDESMNRRFVAVAVPLRPKQSPLRQRRSPQRGIGVQVHRGKGVREPQAMHLYPFAPRRGMGYVRRLSPLVKDSSPPKGYRLP